MKSCDFLGIVNDAALAERKVSVYSFDCVDSTNSLARRMVLAGEISAVSLVIADGQTGGRGRMGRSFFSPADTGIYMTLVLDVTSDSSASVMRLTSAVSVAVSRAIESVTGKSVGIKWVNDLYLDGKKICGILAESFFAGERRYAIVGVGINLSTRDFPSELADIAGSLSDADGSAFRKDLTLAVCCEMYDIYERIRRGDFSYMEEYRLRSVVLGRRVTLVRDGVIDSGVAVSVDDEGALHVRCDDGSEKALRSGEISLRMSEV